MGVSLWWFYLLFIFTYVYHQFDRVLLNSEKKRLITKASKVIVNSEKNSFLFLLYTTRSPWSARFAHCCAAALRLEARFSQRRQKTYSDSGARLRAHVHQPAEEGNAQSKPARAKSRTRATS